MSESKTEIIEENPTAQSANLANIGGANYATLFEKKEKSFNMASEYLEFKKENEQVVLVFIGCHTQEKEVHNKDTGEISVSESTLATFADIDKNTFVTQSVVIVNAVRNMQPLSTVEISYKGEKKLSEGRKVKKYSVTLLG
jgi:hypothetical protein